MPDVEVDTAVKFLEWLETRCPYLFPHILYIATILILVLLVASVARCVKGDPMSFVFGLVKLESRPTPETVRKDAQELLRKSQCNTAVIRLIKDVSRYESTLVQHTANRDELRHHYLRAIDLVINSLQQIIGKGRGDYFRVAVFIVDPADPQKLKILRGAGFSLDGERNLRLPVSDSIAGAAFAGKTTVIVPDVHNDPRWHRAPKATEVYRSLACAPIIDADTTLGVLSVDAADENYFGDTERIVIEVCASQLCSIMRLMRILERVKEFKFCQEEEHSHEKGTV